MGVGTDWWVFGSAHKAARPQRFDERLAIWADGMPVMEGFMCSSGGRRERGEVRVRGWGFGSSREERKEREENTKRCAFGAGCL